MFFYDISLSIYRKFEYHLINTMKRGGHRVNIKEAVEKRILELCREKNIAINTLANISGMPPSTIYSMLNEKSQNPGIVSIKKICDGLDIGIREFFDSELFDNLEQEIK